MLKMDYLIVMDRKVLRIFILLIYVKPQADMAIAVRKFNHQRDMSEYCKRRVAPSVFLGKQVMEANSQILHFSQLEVPYSCTFSVRTESGNNIILVIQLLSEIGLMDACAHNADQLIIYEFGETFGGYWGHLPHTMIKKTTKNYTQFYTLKTTKPITTEHTEDYTTDANENVLMHTYPVATDRPKDFIRIEVPLVNVSGNFQLGSPEQTDNAEEMFDFIYDVTPKNGVEYRTSVLPLVQFSIKKQKVDQNTSRYDKKQRYDIDYVVDGFTFDSRLLFSTGNKRMTTRKRKWPGSRRLNFRRKDLHKLFTARSTSYFTKNRSFTKTVASNSSAGKIADLMEAFGMTAMRSTVEDNFTIRNILNKISNLDHNISVYLAPSLSIYENKNLFPNEENENSGQTTDINLTRKNLNRVALSAINNNPRPNTLVANRSTSLQADYYVNSSYPKRDENQSTNIHENAFNKFNNYDFVTVKLTTLKLDNANKDKSNKNNTDNLYNMQNGTLVDHESWENIVQAAPVMAVVLNKSETFSNKSQKGTEDLNKIDKSKKNKRHIHALEVENSRPRNLNTQRAVTLGTEMLYKFSDLQDFAGLVELQDDEISGRLALRYLRNYVGSALFNICDVHEAKSRQVFLFNTSRIVIAINNFTLEGMTLVLTPAQSLLDSTSLCEPGHLECQIIGTRVCIDSTNACDGVPNCGSYDIYDEDRLKCGVTEGLQHNVYLAAFTFLAVILTMLYTIQYWLKRCVPKVSDAFFIYTDSTENTLLLDTIMRSPNEGDETSNKSVYTGRFFDNNTLYEDSIKDTDFRENCCKRTIRKCCALLFCKKSRENSEYINDVYSSVPLGESNMFSFTEHELRKFAQMTLKEDAVQTGESLEMQSGVCKKEKKDECLQENDLDLHVKLEAVNGQTNSGKYAGELKLIKFTKETRSLSQCNEIFNDHKSLGKMARRHAITVDDEKEIKSTVYERVSNTNIIPHEIRVKCEVHPEKPKKHFDTTRRLRFDEELTMIPSMESGGEITINPLGPKRSEVGTAGQSNQDMDKITQVESETSDIRDRMRFWGAAKGKKGKKKKEKQLSVH